MSPLKIELLMRLYVRRKPNADIPEHEANSPAMAEAVQSFIAQGIVHPGLTCRMLILGTVPLDGILAPEPYLTAKGMALVQRLKEVK